MCISEYFISTRILHHSFSMMYKYNRFYECVYIFIFMCSGPLVFGHVTSGH